MPTDAVAGKAYFACLILHKRLAGKGMRFLPIRQPPAYYKAVSVAELPDDCAIVKPFASKRPIGAKRRKTAMDVASEAGPADGGCEESFADTMAVWEEAVPDGGSDSENEGADLGQPSSSSGAASASSGAAHGPGGGACLGRTRTHLLRRRFPRHLQRM